MTAFNVSRVPAALTVATVCLLGTSAQALPLGPVASSDLAATESRVILPGAGSDVRFPGSFNVIQPALDGDTRQPDLFFSIEDGGIVVSLRSSDPVTATSPRIDDGAGQTLAAQAPLSPSTAVLLIGSGMAGVGATRRRRRRVSRWDEIASPFSSRKEVAGRAPDAPSRIAHGSSYSTPLRI
jgi:hypothetical protein